MDQLLSMDFKVKKLLQNAKQHEYQTSSKHDGELDTIEKIDEKFNDLCSVYEKQFDQILSCDTTVKSSSSLMKKASFYKHPKSTGDRHYQEMQQSQVLKHSQSLKKKQSGIISNDLVKSQNNLLDCQTNSQNQIPQSQRSCLKSSHGSMPQIYSPNFIIRKHPTGELVKQSSIKSFTHLEAAGEQSSQSPLKYQQTKSSAQATNKQNSSSNIYNLLNKPTSTHDNKSSSIMSSMSTEETFNNKTHLKMNEDSEINSHFNSQKGLQRSLSRNQSTIEPFSKYPIKQQHQTSPIKVLPSKSHKIFDSDHQKTVKFVASDSPKIKSLKNIEDVQQNLIQIGIGSLMIEQLRLSQMDLNKVDDINSFTDRQSLLSSKILKEFGIGQTQVAGLKKETEKQDYIIKSIDSTVNNLYKKWVKSYEERMEKIDNMEEEYEEFKEKINRREKQDFEWVKVETQYKALENELKLLIVKKLNDVTVLYFQMITLYN